MSNFDFNLQETNAEYRGEVSLLQEYRGYECLRKYNDRYYIRFYGGYNNDIPCEFAISEEEAKRVGRDAVVIKELIDSAKKNIAWVEKSFYEIGVKDYMLYHLGLSPTRTEESYKKLNTHPDILREFYFFIMNSLSPWKSISVEGYTAERLLQETELNPLGAYNYLIYLREKPEEALANLKKGLPRK